MRQKTINQLRSADRILAAASAIWAADPSAPVDAVAHAAGVGRATLHRHFPSRLDLLRATALAAIGDLDGALATAPLTASSPIDALHEVLSILVTYGDRLHFLLVAAELEHDPEIAAAGLVVDQRIDPVLERATAAGVLRADLPAAWRMRAIEALVYAAWTAVAKGELAANDAPTLLFDTVLRGFGNAAPGRAAEIAREGGSA